MLRVRRPLPLLSSTLALAAVAAAPPPASAAGYACGDQEVGRTRCTRVVVPQDRSGATPGEVGLSVRTIQAGQRRKKVRREAVLFLSGGPGQAATSSAQDVAKIIAPLLRTRDLVAVDTRGTGRSTDLIVCPELETNAIVGLSDLGRFASCARRLGPAIDHYGTADVVADLEQVRVAGGYDRLLLVGVSYGTYTAQRYAAAYPDRVSGMVLDSVVDAGSTDPFTLETYRALADVVANACARGACRGVTDDVARDLQRTRARLPMTASIGAGAAGRRDVTIGSRELIALIQGGDQLPAMRSELPAVLRRAGEGDPLPLARVLDASGLLPVPGDDDDPAVAAGGAASISAGSLVATRCRDAHLPWAPGTPLGEPRRAVALAALAARSDAERGGWSPGDLLGPETAGMCSNWPGESDRATPGPLPDVPTLILSGSEDTRTSPAEARRFATRVPRPQFLSVTGAGHSVLGSGRGCVTDALKAFAAGTTIGRCRTPETQAATPLLPASAAAFGRTGAARARNVARATILDALEAALADDGVRTALQAEIFGAEHKSLRVAGFRSGETTASADRRIRLDRQGFVPGTAVTTGRFTTKDRRVRVLVRGTGLRPGRYTIDNPLNDPAAIVELSVDDEEVEALAGGPRPQKERRDR